MRRNEDEHSVLEAKRGRAEKEEVVVWNKLEKLHEDEYREVLWTLQ